MRQLTRLEYLSLNPEENFGTLKNFIYDHSIFAQTMVIDQCAEAVLGGIRQGRFDSYLSRLRNTASNWSEQILISTKLLNTVNILRGA